MLFSFFSLESLVPEMSESCLVDHRFLWMLAISHDQSRLSSSEILTMLLFEQDVGFEMNQDQPDPDVLEMTHVLETSISHGIHDMSSNT